MQQVAVEETRLGIPLLVGADVIHGYKTIFPIPLGLSCSWDMDIIQRTAQVAAKEATADGIFWNFSPMVDVSRDPRWGRISEGAGEDPYLGSQIAVAMVRGYQGGDTDAGSGESTHHDLAASNTMMATVKHFALYGASEAGRDYNTVDMSRLRMMNDYMAPYKAAIDAGAGCVMSSFNDVDGVPASGNKDLLTDLLRLEWGFKGFVVSDYTSVNEMIAHGIGDLQHVSALAINAGLDMDMVGEGFLTTLELSLKEGKIDLSTIDLACRRVLEAKYKLGLFDNPYRYNDSSRPETDILTVENRALAREAAARSFVLLKNDHEVLPLKKQNGAPATIALVGPLADSQENMLGTWAPTSDTKYAISILEGFQSYVTDGNHPGLTIRHAKGANICDDPDFAAKVNVFGPRILIDERSPDDMVEEAVALAQRSDVVVAVVGEATEMSGESASRTNIEIPENQKRLIRALHKTGKPLVLIIMGGRPLALVEEQATADAILYVWHPGVEAGNAIADVIFGDYNPSGKLSATFPRNVGQVPIYHSIRNTGRPQAGQTFQKFRSNYLDVENSPLFAFGYGLSYTSFHYSHVTLSKTTLVGDQDVLTASVEVANTGSKYAGEEVVQMYIQDIVASVTPPLKQLKGFQKIHLRPGEKAEVDFNITTEDLKFYNQKLEYDWESGDFNVFIGTSSDETKMMSFNWKKGGVGEEPNGRRNEL